jgi:SET domain-containing protein
MMYTVRTYVTNSSIPEAGLGLFAAEYIPQGTQVYEFHPLIDIVFDEDYYNNEIEKMPEPVRDFLYMYTWYDDRNNRFIFESDNGRFANHSSEPNLSEEGVALRDIAPDEELLYDYKKLIKPEDIKPYMY